MCEDVFIHETFFLSLVLSLHNRWKATDLYVLLDGHHLDR